MLADLSSTKAAGYTCPCLKQARLHWISGERPAHIAVSALVFAKLTLAAGIQRPSRGC